MNSSVNFAIARIKFELEEWQISSYTNVNNEAENLNLMGAEINKKKP